MDIRELIIEYILFAFDGETLMDKFQVLPQELESLSDVDLLEIYDNTLLSPVGE
jgi:hypothetical protein